MINIHPNPQRFRLRGCCAEWLYVKFLYCKSVSRVHSSVYHVHHGDWQSILSLSRKEIFEKRFIQEVVAAALALAIETERIAFAPSLDLLGVQVGLIISASNCL